MKKKFQKMLILVFEVIVQPPKTHILTFSKVQKMHYGEKSGTTILKIMDSAYYTLFCLNYIIILLFNYNLNQKLVEGVVVTRTYIHLLFTIQLM